jgi:hypothetical protein
MIALRVESSARRQLIRTEADLAQSLRRESIFHPFRKTPVVLNIPQLSAEENMLWQNRLESLRQECGCRASAIALGCFALAGVVYVTVMALQPNSVAEPDYRALGLNGAVFFVGLVFSALFGKFLGLARANIRFHRTCRALVTRLAAPTTI